MIRFVTAVLTACVALAAAALPAAAAPSRAELNARLQIAESQLAAAEGRIQVLEQRLLTGDPAAVRLQERVDSLESQLRRTTGALERSTFENNALKREFETLQRRLELAGVLSGAGGPLGADPSIAEPGGPVAAPSAVDPSTFAGDPYADARAAASGTLGATQTVVLPDTPAEALDLAKRLLSQNRYAEARSAFEQFSAKFPDAPQTGEALYWKGELAYLLQEFQEAKDLYVNALQVDPAGARAPHAMVRLAAALTQMGYPDQACATLDAFPAQFPNAGSSLRRQVDAQARQAGCGG